jgi:hypothetical protein
MIALKDANCASQLQAFDRNLHGLFYFKVLVTETTAFRGVRLKAAD